MDGHCAGWPHERRAGAGLARAARGAPGSADRRARRPADPGKNDCAATGNNSCAGQAKADYDAKAWKYVAKGSCMAMEVTLKDGMKRKGTLAPM